MGHDKISYYPGDITQSACIGHVNLGVMVTAQQDPKPEVLALIKKIRESEDKAERSELKKHLYYFTPSVTIAKGERRVYANIQNFTGVMQLDFDGEESVTELKDYLKEFFPYCYAIYISPSGNGVKALARIPVVETVEEYKELFLGVEEHFTELGIDSFDHAPFNPILPLYLSYDPDMYVNPNPETWKQTKAIENINSFQNLAIEMPDMPPSFEDETVYKSMAYFRRITMDIFIQKVDEIVSTPGHNRWRDACLVLGSRCGAGYISQADAEQLMQRTLYTNTYLSKGTKGYLKTGYWGLNEGYKRPKYYA